MYALYKPEFRDKDIQPSRPVTEGNTYQALLNKPDIVHPPKFDKDEMVTYDEILNHVGLTWHSFISVMVISVIFAGKGSLGLATTIIVAILKDEWNLNTEWTIAISSLYFIGYAIGA